LADAERIRAAGLSNRVVLLSGFDDPSDMAMLRSLDVDTVVHHESQIAMLESDAVSHPRDAAKTLRVWLKLDTGMHRLGFAPQLASALRARLSALPQVAEVLLMSHFASSDDFGGAQTSAQIATFDAADGIAGEACSLSNSAAILGWAQAHRDWVRAGGALYGLSVVAGSTGADFGLRPAMTLATRLIAINRVRKGEPIGYSATWTCPEDMDIGVAAIGYGDGYPRSVPSGTPVLIRNPLLGDVRVPLVGRVSMDLMTLDLRGAPHARVGDQVVLWGPTLPVEEIATAAGTISYELTCSITRRVRFVES
ncbi:MAG TPA: alanine racemase, partial [Xanthomonadaceae bacterium]|nr:alanine racemase [Xanthomonadaceae bacterium]